MTVDRWNLSPELVGRPAGRNPTEGSHPEDPRIRSCSRKKTGGPRLKPMKKPIVEGQAGSREVATNNCAVMERPRPAGEPGISG